LRHLAGFKASQKPSKQDVLDGVNRWCNGEDERHDTGDELDLENGAVREAIEDVCNNIPMIVDTCYPDCSKKADEHEAGECFGHCVHEHIKDQFTENATALIEKKSRMKLRGVAIFKKEIPTKAQVIEYMEGECMNMDEHEAEERAKAAVCPHAEDLVNLCYPECEKERDGEGCFKRCVHGHLTNGTSLAQTQLRHLAGFKTSQKPSEQEVLDGVNRWCNGEDDRHDTGDNHDNGGFACEGMEGCPAGWRCERPTDAIGTCEPCGSVQGHLTTDCNMGDGSGPMMGDGAAFPTTPMMGGRGPAMPTGPMMGDGSGPMMGDGAAFPTTPMMGGRGPAMTTGPMMGDGSGPMMGDGAAFPTTPMMGGRGPAMPTGPMMGDGPGPMDRR
jgi:hypothetical protein